MENKNSLVENQRIKTFINGSKSVFIAGSTWEKDEELLCNLLHSDLFEKYIIAPHNVDKAHITAILERIKTKFVCYSANTDTDFAVAKILVIDTIGQLASAYSCASIAYVGGGFSSSLHNILEPAVFGLPVIFGPKFDRFSEAQSFIKENIGFSVANEQELNETVNKLLANRTNISQKCINFVEKNTGAAERIVGRVTLGEISLLYKSSTQIK
jgi:3-deoxy-D-manno-octulosonic-acid transferase